MRRIVLCLLFCAICFHTSAQHNTRKPNVIIILADDLGYADVGFNGCKDIPTPNIDKIAFNGVRFTRAYVTYSVCGPSRAGIMTGRYQDRFGFGRNPLLAPNDSLQGLPPTEETLATVLKRSGYTSTALGKWHLGAHKSQYPLKKGFDEFFGFLSGGHKYFPEEWTLNDVSEIKTQFDGYKTKLMRNNGRVGEKEYLTDALSREAVSFVTRHKDNPFFMYLSYNAPHGPLQATEKYLNRFKNIKEKKRKTYAAMVSAMDDGVGLLMDKLKEYQLEENTIVFFLSDNGGPENHNASDNGILRDGKSSLYEGGIHVPFAMQWKGHIPEGKVYNKPVISLDMFAIAVHYASAKSKNKLDGVNLVPFVNGENNSSPHDYLYWRKYDQGNFAIISGDNKVVKYKTETDEFYNLKKDIGENENLPFTEKYKTLKTVYNRWEQGIKKPLFLGLTQDEEYTQSHPNRFVMVNPYKPDTLKPSIPEGYKLLWNDEFDREGKPDKKYWVYEEGFVRNKELQWYQPDNANIEKGLLIIEGRKEQVKNTKYKKGSRNWREAREYAAYTSACVKTMNKFSFKYGIMEVRARIDTSMGMWPAIWTLGVDYPWPACGEVDQMEYYRRNGGAKILANAAWANKKMRPVWDSKIIPIDYFIDKQPDWPQCFHVWKMDWTEDFIRLYLDDELLNEIDLSKTINADGTNPFHQAQYILLNLAIGANGGDPSSTTFPRKYEVDYVRIYQRKK